MKSVIYAVIGLVLYAITNTIIDVRLKQYTTVSLLLGWYVVLFPLAIGLFFYTKYFGQPMVIPAGADLKMLMAVAAIFFVADFFYIGAFTNGGNVVTITILVALVPVVAGLVKYVWVKDVPTRYHLVGFVLALLAVACVAVGNSKKAQLQRQQAALVVSPLAVSR